MEQSFFLFVKEGNSLINKMLLNEIKYFNSLFIIGMFFNLLMSQLLNQPFLPQKSYTQNIFSYLSEYIFFLLPYIIFLILRLFQIIAKKIFNTQSSSNVYIIIILTSFALLSIYIFISTSIQLRQLYLDGTALRDEIFYLSQKDAIEDLNKNKHFIYFKIPDSLNHIILPITIKYRFKFEWPENRYRLININGYNKIVIEYMKYENGFDWEYKFLEDVEKELKNQNVYNEKILLEFKRIFENDNY